MISVDIALGIEGYPKIFYYNPKSQEGWVTYPHEQSSMADRKIECLQDFFNYIQMELSIDISPPEWSSLSSQIESLNQERGKTKFTINSEKQLINDL